MIHSVPIRVLASAALVPLVFSAITSRLSAQHPGGGVGDVAPSPAQTTVEKPIEGLALRLVSDAPVYAPGDRIVLGIRLVNVGKTDVLWADCPVSRARLTVSTLDGTPVPRTRRGMGVPADNALVIGRGIVFRLKSGESRDEQIDLNLLYDLTIAGKYFVTAQRKVMKPDGKWSPIDVVSNKLEIIIDESLLSQTTGEFEARPYTIRIPRFANFNARTPTIVYASMRTYDALVDDLIRQAREIRDKDGKDFILYLLGEMHATAAIPTLLSQIDFDSTGNGNHGNNLHCYSAEGALTRIGISAVDPIIDALGEEQDETRRKLMVSVLFHALGKAGAELVLQQAIDSSLPDVRKRYEQARDGLNRKGR